MARLLENPPMKVPHKTVLATCLVLLLALPIAAQEGGPLELKISPAGSVLRLQAQPDANVTAQLLQQIYAIAGPELGCQILEPSPLLTLAGYSGVAVVGWVVGEREPTASRIEQLNQLLVPQGISLTFLASGRIEIVNLCGLARSSNKVANPYILHFQAESGWKGFYDWEDAQRGLKRKALRAPDIEISDYQALYADTLHGVPEIVWKKTNRQSPNLLRADYLKSDLLECRTSQYHMSSAVEADPAVQEDLRLRGQLLSGVYAAPPIQAILNHPDFLKARREVLSRPLAPELAQEVGPRGWWSDERGRLGLWNAAEREAARQYRSRQLSASQQRILRERLLDLSAAAGRGASIDELVGLCQGQAQVDGLETTFSQPTLIEWVRRGTDEKDGPRHDFAIAAAQASWWQHSLPYLVPRLADLPESSWEASLAGNGPFGSEDIERLRGSLKAHIDPNSAIDLGPDQFSALVGREEDNVWRKARALDFIEARQSSPKQYLAKAQLAQLGGLFALDRQLQFWPHLEMLLREHPEIVQASYGSKSLTALRACAEGTYHTEYDQFKEARPFFEKSLKADPSYVDALAKAGQCDLMLGNKAQANQRLRKALKLAPENATANRALGLYLKQLYLAKHQSGDLEQALQLTRAACRLAPKDYGAQEQLGSLEELARKAHQK